MLHLRSGRRSRQGHLFIPSCCCCRLSFPSLQRRLLLSALLLLLLLLLYLIASISIEGPSSSSSSSVILEAQPMLISVVFFQQFTARKREPSPPFCQIAWLHLPVSQVEKVLIYSHSIQSGCCCLKSGGGYFVRPLTLSSVLLFRSPRPSSSLLLGLPYFSSTAAAAFTEKQLEEATQLLHSWPKYSVLSSFQ